MRTFFILAASAVLLAAVVVELSTRLWPGSSIALLIIAAIALLTQGYLSLRLPGVRPAGTATAAETAQPAAERGESRARSADGRKAREPARPKREQAESAAPAAATGDRESGTVKWFNRTKGFGFIVRESGEEIFVHQRSIRSEGSGDNRRRPSLKDGQAVSFVVANREKGLQAEDVTPS